jgi:hypothetical protein
MLLTGKNSSALLVSYVASLPACSYLSADNRVPERGRDTLPQATGSNGRKPPNKMLSNAGSRSDRAPSRPDSGG